MNRRRNNRALPAIASVLLLACLLVPLASGCGGGKNKPRQVRMNQPPPAPPAVPPRQNVAIDLALRQSARQEIDSGVKSNNPLTRAHAIEAMKDGVGEGSELPGAADAIIKSMSDSAPLVRFASAMAAGELQLAQAKPALLVLSDDVIASVRIGAKFALHRVGDTRQTHDLEATARDPDPRMRGDTALVLGLLGEPSGTRVLGPLLGDQNSAVRLQAAESLWRLKDQRGLEMLVPATLSKFPDDQMIALLALAGPRDRRVMGHLTGALTSDYDEVSLVASRAVGMLGSDAGMGVALRFVKSPDARQRLLAALALGAIGRTDAQDELAVLLKDPDPDVRLAAATAVLQLK